MNIEIITPDKELFKGEATLIQLPGIDGLFEILENHAPLISALQKGKVKLKDTHEQEQFFDIRGGVVEVLHNKVLVLAE
ncbi:MAG TPA: ATP synthase F1 subunit epsilon [Bacteroidales bacterium]|jgi:F-type H+-transporting ATPase subunit epsilon|nr:ATP synthase F1 subunit epsilon [Bacteroidales bacterium]MDD4395397.1 ATP synthase F1 subunit epsilon [Bacteroidales bacterium]HNW67453.1 ATP synthase F1 subunit epsilon [Bacteroidales bacterium]HPT52248.1 ATP synthase F1 subunit epsilon [Bacteroidales bacterium]